MRRKIAAFGCKQGDKRIILAALDQAEAQHPWPAPRRCLPADKRGKSTNMQGRFKYWTPSVALLLALSLSAASSGALAEAVETQSGSETLEIGDTQPGNYLSALIASADRDTMAAEVYYREALRADPRNADLLERAFTAALSNGDESERRRARRTAPYARSEQQPGAPCDCRSRHRSRTIRGGAHLLGGRRPIASAGCDDGAPRGLVLCGAV